MAERFFVQTTPGLEAPCAAEVTALGLSNRVVPGGVAAEGELSAVVPLNRRLRTATRVLWRLGRAADREQLARVALGRVRTAKTPIDLEGPSWAVTEARRAFAPIGSGPDAVTLVLREVGDGLEVSVDTSGEPLYRRGYRQEVGKAPMRETLASAVLALAGFEPGLPLWDPLCGSGTLIIEAARWARGIEPGEGRAFAFEKFPGFNAKALPPLVASAPAPIIGTDLNAGALGVARRNAKRANVFEALTLERVDATRLVAKPGVAPGLVVANLPYGKRVGERVELATLFRGLGARVREQLPGWRYGFLLHEGESHLGLKPDAVHLLENGGIDVKLVVGRVPTKA